VETKHRNDLLTKHHIPVKEREEGRGDEDDGVGK
jgi:hypothetical protein